MTQSYHVNSWWSTLASDVAAIAIRKILSKLASLELAFNSMEPDNSLLTLQIIHISQTGVDLNKIELQNTYRFRL